MPFFDALRLILHASFSLVHELHHLRLPVLGNNCETLTRRDETLSLSLSLDINSHETFGVACLQVQVQR